ncbi:MAG TPA: lipid-binding SYLF domain-containing protein [Burkholderiales bacterium]|nr:lipid-binding SYLF domain-containing protein [Burkholderiales bacterium]
MTRNVIRMAQWASIAAVAAFAGCAAINRGHDPSDVSRTEVQRAQATLEAFRNDTQMAGFRERLKDAKGVVIAPRLGRGGFIFGGGGAEAVALVRESNGRWSSPAFYKLASASVGLQAGADVSEVVMLLMTDKAVNALLNPKFDLGADASIAAGPVGVGTQRDITADVLSYARSRGAYAGLSVGGAYIQPDEAANKAYYGKSVTPTDILVRRNVSNPESAALQRSLSRMPG